MKKPGMPLALIPLSLLLLSITNSAGHSQPIIKVHGNTEKIATQQLVRNCLQQLDVREDFYLIVRFSKRMTRTQPGFTIYQECTGEDAPPIIWVWIKANLNRKLQRMVLIHEMIHVKQFAQGELTTAEGNAMIWRGKKCATNPTDPLDTPWEFEAHRDDGKLAKLVNSRPSKPWLAKRSTP